MQAYQITPGADIPGLTLSECDPRGPGPREVQVRIHAVSLNHRDLMVARGHLHARKGPVIPASDGAGEVVAVGSQVQRFAVGDRVVTSFFPDWVEGDPTPRNTARNLGAVGDGVLAGQVVLDEQALVAMPAHLDYVEASTLPCAAVTAWNALFVAAPPAPGRTVLLQGTGGVSTWALQLARAAGLRTIVTSSSDARLARARELGADATINYRGTPGWQDEVLRLTGGRGADLVLDMGGEGTLARSLAAVRHGGTVAVIGMLEGLGAAQVSPLALVAGGKHLAGICVGNRRSAEALNRFVESAGLRPLVDRVFPFAQAREAYRYLADAQHMGKVVIRVGA